MAADLNAGLMFFGDVLLRVRIAASTVEDGAAGEVVEGIHGSQTAVSEHLAAFVQPEHAPGFRRLQEEAIAEAARRKGEEWAGLGLALKVREKAGRHQARGVARLPLLLQHGGDLRGESPPASRVGKVRQAGGAKAGLVLDDLGDPDSGRAAAGETDQDQYQDQQPE